MTPQQAKLEVARCLGVFASSYKRHSKGETEEGIKIYCDIVCAGTWPEYDTTRDHDIIELACSAYDKRIPLQDALRIFHSEILIAINKRHHDTQPPPKEGYKGSSDA